eukprot:3706979-Karenia_brevis.AAC.1
MKVFDVPPPTFPARHLILSIEPKSDTSVQLVFSGNSGLFRSHLSRLGWNWLVCKWTMKLISNIFV